MTTLRKSLLTLPVVLVFLGGSLLPSAAQHKPVRGLFWKASSPTNTVYLLGSVHLGTKDMYPLPDYMEKAFQRSTTLVVEVNLNAIDKAAQEKIGRYVAANGIYQGDDTLWKHISKTTQEDARTFCSANGIPPEASQKRNPGWPRSRFPFCRCKRPGCRRGWG